MQTQWGKRVIACLATLCLGLALTAPGEAAVKRKKEPAPEGPMPFKYYEPYIQQGDKKIILNQGDLRFKTVLMFGNQKAGLYGIPKEPDLKVDTKPFVLYVFEPETSGANLRLTKLHYVESVPVSNFDLRPTPVEPGIFEKVYHTKYDATMPINMWCVEKDISLEIVPVEDKPGVYRAIPQEELGEGIYSLNFGFAEGPRHYTGDRFFYPFNLAKLPPPPQPETCKPKAKKRKRVEEVCLPPLLPPKAPAPVAAAPPPAGPKLDADLTYTTVSRGDRKIRREYQITNLNNFPWHNANISLFTRDGVFPELVLGPVTLYHDVVLPTHTVNKVQDKTFLHYDTLEDQGSTLYLKVKTKEGVVRKAWKNVSSDDSGQATLREVPYDLKEEEE